MTGRARWSNDDDCRQNLQGKTELTGRDDLVFSVDRQKVKNEAVSGWTRVGQKFWLSAKGTWIDGASCLRKPVGHLRSRRWL